MDRRLNHPAAENHLAHHDRLVAMDLLEFSLEAGARQEVQNGLDLEHQIARMVADPDLDPLDSGQVVRMDQIEPQVAH
jgi:hypothetical protein